MKFGISKKRLLAAFTTLAMAFSNLSGLELGAEATLLNIPEYTANVELNDVTYHYEEIDEYPYRKFCFSLTLSELLEHMTDVKKLDPETGEYRDVDFELPEEYSAVWVNGEKYDFYGEDTELDLSDYANTDTFKYHYENGERVIDSTCNWKELDLIFGSGKQLDPENKKLKLKVSRSVEHFKKYKATLDISKQTYAEAKAYTTEQMLKDLKVYDYETGERIDYDYSEAADIWTISNNYDKKICQYNHYSVDDKTHAGTFSSSLDNWFSIYSGKKFIIGKQQDSNLADSLYDRPEFGKACFELTLENDGIQFFDFNDFTVSMNEQRPYETIHDAGRWFSDHLKNNSFSSDDGILNYHRIITDYDAANEYYLKGDISVFDEESDGRYTCAELKRRYTDYLANYGAAIHVFRYEDFAGYPDTADRAYREYAGDMSKEITDEFFYSEKGVKGDYSPAKDEGDFLKNTFVIIYTELEEDESGVKRDTGRILARLILYADILKYEPLWPNGIKNFSVSSGEYKDSDLYELITTSSSIPYVYLHKDSHTKEDWWVDEEGNDRVSYTREYYIDAGGYDSAPSILTYIKKDLRKYPVALDSYTISFDCFTWGYEGQEEIYPVKIVDRQTGEDVTEALKTGYTIYPEEAGLTLSETYQFPGYNYQEIKVYGPYRFSVTFDDGSEYNWYLYLDSHLEDSERPSTREEVVEDIDDWPFDGDIIYDDIINFYAPLEFNVSSMSYMDGGKLKKAKTKILSFDTEKNMYMDLDASCMLGWQTTIIADDLTDEQMKSVVPTFESMKGTEIGVFVGQNEIFSGTSPVDFSGETVPFRAATRSHGEHVINHAMTYNITAAHTVKGKSRLFVNGPEERDVFFNSLFGQKHDIIVLNLGDELLTGLNVELKEAKGVKLDDYWTVGGKHNDTLKPFVDADGNFTDNMARVRLLPDGSGDASSGYLEFTADGGQKFTVKLRGIASVPTVTTSKLDNAVKYVPYSTIVNTDNSYSWITERFALLEGALPDGMSLNYETGEIYGAPLEKGTFSFTVGVDFVNADTNAPLMETVKKSLLITVEENSNANVYNETDWEDGYGILLPIGTETDPTEHKYEFGVPVDSELLARYEADPGNEALFREILDSVEDLGDICFFSEGEFDEFVKVWFNGVELRPDEYSAVSGSTEVTIYENTVKEHIKEGTNTIAIEFRNEDDELKKTAQNIEFELVEKFFSDIALRLTNGSGSALADTLVELHSKPLSYNTDNRGIVRFSGIVSGHHTIYVNGSSCAFDIKKGTELGFGNNIITASDGAKIMLNAQTDGGTLRIVSVGEDTDTDIGGNDDPDSDDTDKNGDNTDPNTDIDADKDSSDSKEGDNGDNGNNSGNTNGSDGSGNGNTVKTGEGNGGTPSPTAPSSDIGEGSPVKPTGSDSSAEPADSGETTSDTAADDTPSAKTGKPANYALMAISLILFATAFRRKEER